MALVVRSVCGVAAILIAAACADVPEPPSDDAVTPASQTTVVASTRPVPANEATSSTTAVTTSSSATSTAVVTTTSLTPVSDLESGLFCRDLLPRGYAYSEAVAYWTNEGQPDRMDTDLNGIPCETVYDRSVIRAFWGDPLPTTTAQIWYAVGRPSYAPAALSGSKGAAGSGCSPGTAALPDGIWFVFIETAASEQITFDLACIWPGKAMDEGFITNDSDRLRSIGVAADAAALQVVEGDGIDWVPMPYTEWLVAPPDPDLCSWPCDAAWLYVNNGVVTELVQLFFP